MSPFKFKLKREAAEGLKEIIEKLLPKKHESDDDKLVMATLAEIASSLTDKLQPYKSFKPEFTIKISPAQAIALRILSVDYVAETTTYMGNQLHRLSNEIHQHYSTNLI